MELLNSSSQLIVLLFLLSLLPLLMVMGTSFLKLSIVFSLLRNALGVQQVPPNIAIYGLALVLTIFIMAPVGLDVHVRLQDEPLPNDLGALLHHIDEHALEPYRDFLQRNTDAAQVHFFNDIVQTKWPVRYRDTIKPNSLLILMPAFTLSQLTEAFKIGLLLYLPFVAIDLIVSNILLAMGMMMVSPITISLPFKLLIFILIDGWGLLLGQLVGSYL
ncbi:EscR/YscR/HrcR family type III secretion system export apparatus protein [Yersinia enterocolitica]|uniref:type III secretion system export apparatus subunit SctR n=1 Tax=Yersinia enterocolitica TaxID=630 RepID=UPI0021E8630A|nr:type III secretion system export apparatus subunit SctR [Yersinia enterocolitica]EKN3948342.1 type III secretion system export apparatus subunit SctR [Yersinia enterocolitica]EKN6314865.1 EscR/YscR/HrcR family type III secretion system export apparatus protein [Yersinia enterocolitica]UYJ97111.1 type III secretion system export apparatus subunit SctR [Yersinia enterocolitica]